MNHRTPLLAALEAVTAARRDYQAELDTARTAQLATTAPVTDEQIVQTLRALVRELDNAARELADAIRTCDQRGRVIALQAQV
jgi:hypothetical protein